MRGDGENRQMPLTWIKSFFRQPTSQHVARAATKEVVAARTETPAKLSYPPSDKGLPFRDADDLLAANKDLLSRLKLQAATDAEVFEARFLQPIRRLALQVNSLPATPTGHFSGDGGLMRAAIELAFFSYQASDGRIFTGNETVERRHKLEGRWRYVCFLSGLVYPIGKSLESVIVADAKGQVWKRHFSSVSDWATSVGADRLYATWAEDLPDDKAIGPSSYSSNLIRDIAGAQNLQWIEDGSPELVKALYEIGTGQKTSARNAEDVVKNMWEKISRREAARRPQAFGRVTVGNQVGPYLIGAISELIRSKTWVLNGPTIKADTTGIYLVWPHAAGDIIQYGRDHGYPGWPADASTIGELLKATGIVDPAIGDDLGFKEVYDEDGVIHQAYKFAKPLSVVEDFDPSDYKKSAPKTVEGLASAEPITVPSHATSSSHKAAKSKQDSIDSEQVEESALPGANATLEDATGQGDLLGGASDEASPAGAVADSEASVVDRPQATTKKSKPPKVQVVEMTATGEHDETAEAGQPRKLREGGEVQFGELVADEVKKTITKALHVELLGKLIHAWKTQGEYTKVMRKTDKGLAVSFAFLTTIIREVPAFVGEMSSAGLIYVDPAARGQKFQQVAMPDGGKPVQCVIFSTYAVRKLDL